eukprot:PhF_6_TR31807/c0_g1_i3/m.46936/K01539/ATP1A; sodium/potassium-transporting ATPase subunit alpha
MSLIAVEFQRAKQSLRNSINNFLVRSGNSSGPRSTTSMRQTTMDSDSDGSTAGGARTANHDTTPTRRQRTNTTTSTQQQNNTMNAQITHTIPLPEFERRLDTDLRRGLSTERVAAIAAASAASLASNPNQPTKNIIPHIHIAPLAWRLITPLFVSQFAPILWFAAILSLIAHLLETPHKGGANSLVVTIVVMIIIVMIAIPNWLQQARFIRHLKSLDAAVVPSLPRETVVIRDGVECSIPTQDLVVGDLVRITSSCLIPADMRIVEVRGLLINSSSLTGESQHTSPTLEPSDPNPLVSTNMTYAGSKAVSGFGYGVVVAIGVNTQMAKIIASCSVPLRSDQEELEFFVKAVMIGALLAATAVVVAAVVMREEKLLVSGREQVWGDVLADTVDVVIAFIPTGLPLALAGTFHMMSRILADRGHFLVGSSSTLETLGRVSVVCTDKTGTLTFNALSVVHVMLNGELYYAPEPEEYGSPRNTPSPRNNRRSRDRSGINLNDDESDVASRTYNTHNKSRDCLFGDNENVDHDDPV